MCPRTTFHLPPNRLRDPTARHKLVRVEDLPLPRSSPLFPSRNQSDFRIPGGVHGRCGQPSASSSTTVSVILAVAPPTPADIPLPGSRSVSPPALPSLQPDLRAREREYHRSQKRSLDESSGSSEVSATSTSAVKRTRRGTVRGPATVPGDVDADMDADVDVDLDGEHGDGEGDEDGHGDVDSDDADASQQRPDLEAGSHPAARGKLQTLTTRAALSYQHLAGRFAIGGYQDCWGRHVHLVV